MGAYRNQAILASVLVFVCFYPPHANATIYRCTAPGKPDSYQSTPCDAGTAQADVSSRGASGDPLLGEFSGRIVLPRPETDRVRLRVTREGGQYSVFLLLEQQGANDWRPIPAKLGPCPPDVIQSILGDHWRDFDPVGVCIKGFFLIHTRHGKVIREMASKQEVSTTGYAAFIYQIGAGAWLELEKLR